MARLSTLLSWLAGQTCTQCQTSWAYQRILREYIERVGWTRPFQAELHDLRGRQYIDHYHCAVCGHITEKKGWTLYEQTYKFLIVERS